MIIDHDESKRTGRIVELAAKGEFSQAVDETMSLLIREVVPAVTPVVAIDPASEDGVVRVDYKEAEEKTLSASKAGSSHEVWKAMRKGFTYRHSTGIKVSNLHGNPPPLVGSMTGRLSIKKPAITVSLVHPDRPLFVASTEGVEQGSCSDTSTFALPVVEKMTGKPSAHSLAHRTAASVQRVFNEAGWGIAVWYGEYTKTFWVMDEIGLHEFKTITAMYQGMGWEAL